ncbi:hypothetical protein [Pectobacterium atrosepticum]|uniref:hypothetical protein n=1 Tax=Pectobacterium atrosepticum TaxID=29471 RepID=UPI003019538E
MNQSQNEVSHLLWCILIALRSAEEKENIKSETAKRKFIAQWLNCARRNPVFQNMPSEFATIRELITNEKHISIDSFLTTLWQSAISSEKCDLFRFRAAFNTLLSKGWRHCLCIWPEQLVTEVMQRQKSRNQHILQLTDLETAFSPTGSMSSPVTLQLILKKEENDLVERTFYNDRFSVVRGRQTQINKATIRTLYIGHHSLPESSWGPNCNDLWRPTRH